MRARQLISALFIAATLTFAWPQGAAAVNPTTYFGMAVVTAATSACASSNWTVGRIIPVNYREQTDATHPRFALRFSDSTFTVVATQRPNTSWSGPAGAMYDAEVSGLDVNVAINYTGHAQLQIWTSTAVPNARYMPSGEFTNWANIAGCTLTLRATMIQR